MRYLIAMAVVAVIAVVGCGRPADLTSPTAIQMRGLATVYLDFAAAKGKGPANEQQLLKHIRNVPAMLLESTGIGPQSSIAAFVSERDGEPIVIRYGVGISQQKGPAAEIIACEKKGKDGTRYVAYANGQVNCIDERAAKELMHEKL